MSWFVDSWAVRDGFAFASEREADTVDTRQTVFIAPPDFEPIPIAKISTALFAARGHFQDRLLDAEGNEIPFDTLDQIIEMVRRAYLQGGSGLLPPAGPPGPEGPPTGERPSPPEDVPPEESPPSDLPPERGGDRGGPGQGGGGQSSGSRAEITGRIHGLQSKESRALLAASFVTRLMTGRDSSLLDAFIGDTTREFLRRLRIAVSEGVTGEEMTLFLKTLAVWVEVARRLELLGAVIGSLETDERGLVQKWLYEFPWWYGHDGGELMQQTILHGFFHRLPLLPQWNPKPSSTQPMMEVNSVGDVLGAVAADRNRLFELIEDWVSFIPIVYCSLALSAVAERFVNYSPTRPAHDVFLHEIRRKAAEWLSQLLPGKELDGHVAADIISSLDFGEPEQSG